MALHDRLQLPDDRAALVVLQDGRVVTAGQVEQRSNSLAADLRRLQATRTFLSTGRADQVIVALFACQAAGCDLVLHRGPGAGEELVSAMKADVVLGDDFAASPRDKGTPTPTRPQVILMTSGTTGIPKAAGHDLDRLAGLIPEERPGPTARWLLTYHPASFAGFQVILTALLGQAPLAALASPDVVALTRLALDFKPTSISGTPTFWRAFLLALSGEAGRVPLRHATLGGEAADQATLDRVRAHFPGARVTHIYASTEAGAVFAVRDGRAGFPAEWLSGERSGLAMRIEDGVLQLRSPRRMVDGDRVLFCGRANSVINVGGQKVLPEEVEALLLQVPGVVDVQVKGVRNPITGELVAADIVVAPGLDAGEMTVRVKEAARALPAYAAPRIVKIVPELAVTAGGKKHRA
jgi:acyl-CoA synthetase (AMP-forming)/AMP-acid ligase II